MNPVSRRDFIRTATLAAATTPALKASPLKSSTPSVSASVRHPQAVRLNWLEASNQGHVAGNAFGVPWPMGQHQPGTSFSLMTPEGERLPMQTWTTATWPDGSLKWTGHALAPDTKLSASYQVSKGPATDANNAIKITAGKTSIEVDTGLISCSIPTSGAHVISSIKRNNRITVRDGQLIGTRQDRPEHGANKESFRSEIETTAIEQEGPLRAVIKLTGHHLTEAGRKWLPFTLRLYFFSNSEAIRMTHTFIFDGDENKDFLSSLGVCFKVPMPDEAYNRHVRFAGQEGGIWTESVQGLTGLRRDPGKSVRDAQIAGERVPDIATWNEAVSTRVHWIPKWGDFTLSQPNANGFTIRKRTKPGHGWIPADQGKRSDGLGYIGGPSGGLAFGMRDFWKLHPTQLDIRKADTEEAEVSLWMWSPESPAMDIRFYHDGMGQDIDGPLDHVSIKGIQSSVPHKPYAKQLDALQVTYEDYEPGFGTPHGIARSTDITLWATAETPSNKTISAMAGAVARPPQLVPDSQDMLAAGVFSNMWARPNHSTAALRKLEDRLHWSLHFYKDQVEQRHWYGFWDYGDVMHTYDKDRHVWRYDVGGYAWDNSELSTDMWLWYSFLRTGDPVAFRLAEAMNRHNRDVDIYHIGRFKGFGTRHNVQHWGCSAKQLRISTCMNRRFHYFLTTDERTGDVLQEVVEADRQLATLNPRRKLPGEPFKPDQCIMSPGTDYGSAVSNWLTAWERTGEDKYRRWIENSMRDIGNAKWGFFTGSFRYDPETKKMDEITKDGPSASHLSIMFGLPEVVAELIQLLDVPEFKKAWLRYCRLCNAPKEVTDVELEPTYKAPGFLSSHSRIAAYAAAMTDDDELAKKAARDLLFREWPGKSPTLRTKTVKGPDVLNPIDEATWVNTNESAQWGLAAMQASALIPEAVSSQR